MATSTGTADSYTATHEHSKQSKTASTPKTTDQPAHKATLLPGIADRPASSDRSNSDLTESGAINSESQPGQLESAYLASTIVNEGHGSSETKSNKSPLVQEPSDPSETCDSGATLNSPPPLPNEPVPEDDGWDYNWDPTYQRYFFYNRFTHQTTWENPRIASDARIAELQGRHDSNPGQGAVLAATTATTTATAAAAIMSAPDSVAGGYNPAIHGDYDPNAWYAQSARAADEALDRALHENPLTDGAAYDDPATSSLRQLDEARSRRQAHAYFDVDSAANAHDGRSLRAERAGRKPSKSELRAFKERRRVKKEEKRRAWLRD